MISMELTKTLNKLDLVAIGIGNIIGSGIFILFGNILRKSHQYSVLAFILAALPNIILAMSYSEIASMYQSNAMEYESIKDAFGETVASLSSYILLAFLVFNTATVLVFGGNILHIPNLKFYLCLLLLFILSFINFLGIDITKKITNAIAVIELVFLTAIIVFGMKYWNTRHIALTPPTKANDISVFLVASFLAMFLYTGYDTVVKMTEETKNAEVNVPFATVASVVVTTIIYILLCITAVSLPQYSKVISHVSPLTVMATQILHIPQNYACVITAFALLLVLNTFFISIVTLSRFVFSLSRDEKLPSFLSYINPTFKTPSNAIITVFLVIGFVLLIESGEKAAALALIFCMLFSALINAAVLVLKKKKQVHRTFTTPTILPILGIISSLAYIAVCFYYFHMIE